ncbi:uncharacterized protein LOC133118575 [Conger conger]|uniref:uncharacterized protein LOC133118575 n=1 Tax=Conger conger TaxID=82655 RepID=UPI002A5A4FC1|nr:uncharacterized protein LOC133118575 [Conger conger]
MRPLTELAFDQQIGNLLGTEKRMLELHLCKKEKQDILYPKSNAPQGAPFHNLQGNLQTKEEKIRELNQHVDSLQNVIHQVQELHRSLVAFCGELRSMESEPALKGLTPGDLEAQLGLVQRRVLEKQQSVQAMQDRLSSSETRKSRCPEVHLLDKMKLDCQIFKEEISIIHLNRQAARLKSALQEFHAKCPAVLLMAHEEQNEGRYGFTARCTEAGLEVVSVEDSQLCLHDRLVEVNGVSVLDSGEDELSDLLSCRPSARIVVLRKPPPLPPKPGRVPEPGPARPRGAPPPRCQVIAT